MKILFVSHRFPFPPKRGGKIRPYNVIRHLHESGHEVTVGSLVRSAEEAAEGEGLAPYCKEYMMGRVHDSVAWARMFRRLPTSSPSSMGYFYSRELKQKVSEKLRTERFDLIFVHCSSVAQYVEDTKNIPMIIDFGDMDSQKWLSYGTMKPFPLSMGYYVEGLKMQLAEVAIAKKFDVCTVTTKAERATLQGLALGCKTDWYPNGVDAERFAPTDEPYDRDLICFVGRMDYYPNQDAMFDFTEHTLPLIQQRRPSTKLVIVGADPSPQVRALAKKPGVEVTGSVPEVQPFVRKAAFTVAPLNIARGTQNKILESLAMGVPVISSPLAAAGVDCEPDEHILVADRPQQWADACIRLLDSPEERAKLADAGRQRMLSNHSWSSSMKRVDAIIEDCLATAGGRHKEAL